MAFALLNLLAVLFGATVAHWLPQELVVALVGVLFLAFGLHALRNAGNADDRLLRDDRTGSHGIFVTTFLLIALAEFGDKTQLVVAGMSSTADPLAVWLGATLALAGTSGFGVWAGRTLLQRIPLVFLHCLSGMFFTLLGLVALASLLR
jgi:putative Ca2+/H+ antiporter (TMEM165/GDT1 family)